MSGLDISSGGAVAVDTGSLRHAADRFHGVVGRLQDIAAVLRGQGIRIAGAAAPWPDAIARHVSPQTVTLDLKMEMLVDGICRIGSTLLRVAAVYEIVEVRVAAAQAAAGRGPGAGADADERIEALEREFPGAARDADALVSDWNGVQSEQMMGAVGGPPGLGFLVGGQVSTLIGLTGLGRLHADAASRDPGKVALRQVGRTATAAPPHGLADMVGRIPTGEKASAVRVERYTMKDGTRRYVAYIRGTRDWNPLGSADPFDLRSNLTLYGNESSTSYKATLQALERAGAKKGDTVDLVGHSQGGMVAGRMALDGPYRTDLLVTAGSPTEAQVSRNVTQVQLKHTDDIVPQLADGGSPAPVGAEGSITVSRETSGTSPHAVAEYGRTAAELDASDDRRVDAARERIAALDDAASVEVFEFDAERAPETPSHPIRVPDPHSVPGIDVPFVADGRRGSSG